MKFIYLDTYLRTYNEMDKNFLNFDFAEYSYSIINVKNKVGNEHNNNGPFEEFQIPIHYTSSNLYKIIIYFLIFKMFYNI